MIGGMSDLERVLRRLARLLEPAEEREDEPPEAAVDDPRKPDEQKAPPVHDLRRPGAATG
jgi:hypothetical protein